MVRIQYHDVGARIGAHVAGKRKKCVKKVQNYTFSALVGGGGLHLVHEWFWSFAAHSPPKTRFVTWRGGALSNFCTTVPRIKFVKRKFGIFRKTCKLFKKEFWAYSHIHESSISTQKSANESKFLSVYLLSQLVLDCGFDNAYVVGLTHIFL